MGKIVHGVVLVMVFLCAPLSVSGEAFSAPELQGLAELAHFFPQGCHHAGHYSQEIIADGFDGALRSSGAFVFACDRGLIWANTSPYIEVWVYPREGRPKQRDEQGVYRQIEGRVHQELGQLLNRLIGGDVAYLAKYFSISSLPQGLRLLPVKKRMSKFITSIELLVDMDKTVITLQQAMQQRVITIFDDEPYSALNSSVCVNKLGEYSAACGHLVN